MRNSTSQKATHLFEYQNQILSLGQIKVVKTGVWVIVGLVAGRFVLQFLSGAILAFHDLVAAIRNQRNN